MDTSRLCTPVRPPQLDWKPPGRASSTFSLPSFTVHLSL